MNILKLESECVDVDDHPIKRQLNALLYKTSGRSDGLQIYCLFRLFMYRPLLSNEQFFAISAEYRTNSKRESYLTSFNRGVNFSSKFCEVLIPQKARKICPMYKLGGQ